MSGPTKPSSKFVDHLEDPRDLFASLRRDPDLSTNDTIDRLSQKTLRSLANLVLQALSDVLSQASLLLPTVRTDDAVLDRIKPLIKAALADDPDDTMIAELVSQATSHITTPTRQTTEASLDSNPITYSSTSQTYDETRELLEARIFNEIKDCTYRSTKGFFEKYFEGRPWSDHAQRVYEAIKTKEYSSGQWVGLRGSPNKKQVLNWIFHLQDSSRLSEASRRYHTIDRTVELGESEANRQIDILVKRMSAYPIFYHTTHDWTGIEVIGQLKTTSCAGVRGPLTQLTRYARNVFIAQPTRRFLHAFTICGSKMEAWVYHRSAVFSAGAFDIHQEPERFIRVLSGYLLMDEDELGLDTFIRRDGDSFLIDIDRVGHEDTQTPQRLQLQLNLKKALARRPSIMSRGTTCYSAKALDASDNTDYVAKFSWPPKTRRPEADLLRLANERGVQGIARLAGYCDITSIGEMQAGMRFPKRYHFEAGDESPSALTSYFHPMKRKWVQTSAPSKRQKNGHQPSAILREDTLPEMEDTRNTNKTSSLASDNGFDDRVFRCLVTSPAGRPIHTYESPLELLEALRDAIKAHESLYNRGKILHRDISENNIIITDRNKTGGFSGILIDLDHAEEVNSKQSGACCRTGTMEFMAIEVLLGDTKHTYRHDLESFFYVLLWLCIRHCWEAVEMDDPRNPSLLTSWSTGTFHTMATHKCAHMAVTHVFDRLLGEFPEEFNSIKPLCRDLRLILFTSRDGEGFNFFRTPDGHPDVLYKPIIKAFDKAINDMRASGAGPGSPADESSPSEESARSGSSPAQPRTISTRRASGKRSLSASQSAAVRSSLPGTPGHAGSCRELVPSSKHGAVATFSTVVDGSCRSSEGPGGPDSYVGTPDADAKE